MSSARAAEAAITYREQAPRPVLAPWVRCLWQLTVQGDGGPGRIVPDGFMDLVAGETAVTLAGPDTRPWPVVRRGGETVVGIRFHPGAAPSLLGPSASGLLDTRVTPDAIWGQAGRELAERVVDAPSPAARLERGPAEVRVGTLGPDLGLGERQLRRRFLATVGYGPKTLARILRFQRLLARRPARRSLAFRDREATVSSKTGGRAPGDHGGDRRPEEGS